MCVVCIYIYIYQQTYTGAPFGSCLTHMVLAQTNSFPMSNLPNEMQLSTYPWFRSRHCDATPL